jgi:CheY-like chemotaxis protein
VKCKILIADDHQDTAETLAGVMAFLGHEVRCAFDGGQALGLASEFEPDVVMLDINMPVADGYEVARSLRATGRGRLLIIAMTGARSIETAQKAKDAGFDVHMTKPVAIADIEGILGRAGFH